MQQAAYYEVAAGWWGDPLFATVLQRAYGEGGMARSSLEALLYGPADLGSLAAAKAESLRSHNFAPSGIGILRRANHYALVKYGPHGGGHGHPDKLELVLYGMGERLGSDLGTPGYGVPLHPTWYKQTVSHNTMLVDETSQQPTTGELLAWAPGEHFDAITVAAKGAYPGVELRRTVILTDDMLVLVDRARSSQAHTYDWVYHSEGQWHRAAFLGLKPGPVGAPPFRKAGYEHLANVELARPEGAWRVGWSTPAGKRYTLWMAADPGTQVFLADGPDNPATRRLPFVIVRRQAKETTWAGVFDLTGKDVVQSIALLQPGTEAAGALGLHDGDLAVQVAGPDGITVFAVGSQGSVRQVR